MATTPQIAPDDLDALLAKVPSAKAQPQDDLDRLLSNVAPVRKPQGPDQVPEAFRGMSIADRPDYLNRILAGKPPASRQEDQVEPLEPEELGLPSVSEQLANRPGPPVPQLPAGLQSPQQQLATQPILRSRTGSLYQTPATGQSIFDVFPEAPSKIAQGVEQIAGPASRGTLIQGGIGAAQPKIPLTPADARQAAAGASQIAGGAMTLAAPVAIAGAMVAPVATLATLGAGTVADIITQKGLKAAGVAPEYADLAGTIAAVLAGYGASRVQLTPNQQSLVSALGGEDSAAGAAGASRTIEALKATVDRGGTVPEQVLAQQVLQRRFGIKYGPDLSATPPAEEAAPAATAKATTVTDPLDEVLAKVPSAKPAESQLPETTAVQPATQPELPQPNPATSLQSEAPQGLISAAQGPHQEPSDLARQYGISNTEARDVQNIAAQPTPAVSGKEAIQDTVPESVAQETAGEVTSRLPAEPEEPDVAGGRTGAILDPKQMDPATRQEYSRFLDLLKGDAGDNLGFDRTKDAISAILMHSDWASRWDVRDPELIALGNKFGGWTPPPTETGSLPPQAAKQLPSAPGVQPQEQPVLSAANPPNLSGVPEGEGSPELRGPGWVGNIPTSEINVDAPRFQFKANVGQGGAGEELREVTKYDPEKAGVTAVWRDPADGKTYVVNGHHRVELAQRTGYPEMTVRYLDADTAQQARLKGAMINIAEGRGESTDAAKVFRDSGMTPEQLQGEGVSLKGKIASEGLALSNLSAPIFSDVISGELSPARGAVIGAGVKDPGDQEALYDLIKQREKSGRRLTNDQVAELIRLTNEAPKQTESQESLFGTEEMTRSLLPEKAEVSDYVRKQLATERKLFGAVGTQAAAEKLGEAGNVIKAGENAQQAERANQGMLLYDKLSSRSGPIADSLDRAARSIAEGEPSSDVKQRTYREIRDALKSQVRQLSGVPQVNDNGTQGLGAQGTHEVGAGQRNQQVDASAFKPPANNESLFTPEEEGQSQAVAKSGADKLLGDQLTAQIKSGLAAKPSKLKPIQNRGLFEEEGPEQGALFYKPPVIPEVKGRIEKYSRNAPVQFHAERTAISPIELPDQFSKIADAYAITRSGVELVGRAAGKSPDAMGAGYAGVHFSPKDTGALARNIGYLLGKGEMPAGARDLQKALEKASAEHKSLILVVDHPMYAEWQQTALREELGHALQATLGGSTRAHFGKALQGFTSSPIFKQASAHLNQTYNDVDPNAWQTAVEVGVRLLRPDGYKELGISPQQARSLATTYVSVLRGEYGKQAAAIAKEVFDGLRGLRTGRNQPAPSVGINGAERGSGTPAVSGQDLSGYKPPTGAGGTPGDANPEGETPEHAVQPNESERGSFSLKSTKTPEQIQQEKDQQFAQNMRDWFTGRRDQWAARVHQRVEQLRRELPNVVDREGLYLMRDMRNHPGELQQYVAMTHPVLGTVPNLSAAQQNIEKLKPAIEKALHPTPAMLKADAVLTNIAEASLREGKRLGIIDKHVSPDEYVTHLLQQEEEGNKVTLADRMGRAMGGKIGRNFPYNQQRTYPTIMEAIANNERPKTLDALTAFEHYGDIFATARATHMLINQLRDAGIGKWGTKKDKGIPKDWVEIAPHAHPFRNMVAFTNDEGEPAAAYQTLFVPPTMEQALRPITDPDYSNKIAGFSRMRAFQSYTKAAQMGLSFFHAVTENYMAMANMGPRGYAKALALDRFSPEFQKAEARYIGHGLTTSVQGKTYEMAEGISGSLPTAGEAWKSLPGIQHIGKVAEKITDFTFNNMQRRFKVGDMAWHEAGWLATHKGATPEAHAAALRSMAKEVNAVYGGLHWENLGVNKITANVARALLLAPDWTFSNIFNLKYAFEGGKTPSGKMARAFWTRAVIGGMLATQLMSLMLGHKMSKRPTQVYMGTDADGNEVYQNIFFKGAPGDIATAIGNIKDYGAVEGLVRTIGNKAPPIIRVGVEALRNQTFLGRPIVSKNMNPLESTARGAVEAAKGLAPIPWSFANIGEMLFGPEAYKYTPGEIAATMFAGTPPSHVAPVPDTDATKFMKNVLSEAPGPKSTPTERQQIMRRIGSIARSGKDIEDGKQKALPVVIDALKAGKITPDDADHALQRALGDPLEADFRRLPTIDDKIETLKRANPSERIKLVTGKDPRTGEQIGNPFTDYLERALDKAPPAEQQRILQHLQKAGLMAAQ